MRYKHIALCLLSVMIAAVQTVASAQQLAYASTVVNLRAGPSRDYPVVATLSSGTSMTIYGCLQGYRWCDVVVGPYRGWVYSGSIVYPYLGQNVPIMDYGSTLGLGIVTFSIGNYWDNHYAAYPWYPQRQNWASRPWAGYGSGYGTGFNWRAPTAQVRPVTPAARLPQAQVRPVAPQVQNIAPQRVPRAQVQGVGPSVPPGQVQGRGANGEIWPRGREGRP
jgi:uncharacterized protein YraI